MTTGQRIISIPPLLSSLSILFLLLLAQLHPIHADSEDQQQEPQKHQNERSNLQSTNHDTNVAILLSSSTFFHNYRHTTNALALYHSLKKNGGYTDDNIMLFLGDEVACNARNPFKGKVYPYTNHDVNLFSDCTSTSGSTTNYYGNNRDDDNKEEGQTFHNLNLDDVQVDYAGSDVTVENLFRVLLGRHAKHTPKHQKLPMDRNRNIHTATLDNNTGTGKTNLLLYITGHGGDNFFKFRDQEDFSTKDLRAVFEQLEVMDRFHSVLFISDTCQAFTLAPNTKELEDQNTSGDNNISVKNVYTIGTSLKDESSYAHHSDPTIGHSVMDRYIHYLLDYMGGGDLESSQISDDSKYSVWSKMNQTSVKEALIDSMYYDQHIRHGKLGGDPGYTDLGCDVKMQDVPLSDFFEMKQKNIDDATLILDQVDFWS